MSAPTRRTVVRGAAWSVPVIALAAQAPAFAASGFTCSPSWCKKQNRQNKDRWDFTVYVNGTVNGKATNPGSVVINGKAATLRTDARGRVYFDLRNQPHSYTFSLLITAPVGGGIVFNRVVDTRMSACPA